MSRTGRMTEPAIKTQSEAVREWFRWRGDLAARFVAWCRDRRAHPARDLKSREFRDLDKRGDLLRAELVEHWEIGRQLVEQGADLSVNPYVSRGTGTRQ